MELSQEHTFNISAGPRVQGEGNWLNNITSLEIPSQRERENGKEEIENKGSDDNWIVLCSEPNISDEDPSLYSTMLIHLHEKTKEIWQNYQPDGCPLS